MRSHSLEGERICLTLRSVAHYLPVIRHHHERVDGTGYPDRLCADRIPLGARIVAVADAWDATTSDRPYRAGRSPDEALEILEAGMAKQWDAQIVEAFCHLVQDGVVVRVAEKRWQPLGASEGHPQA